MNPSKKLLVTFLRLSFSLLSPELKREYQTVTMLVVDTGHQFLSPHFLRALILAEDKRYFSHLGFDSIAVARAIWSLLFRRKLQGASTIEQQLVRTVTRRYEITVARKLREILLASVLSASFPKDQMARAYLSVAYFGWQMNGVRQACKRLSVDPMTATAVQAAQIIARLKYPEPDEASPKRLMQIQNRAHHILRLQRASNNLDQMQRGYNAPITQYKNRQ